VTIHFAPEAEHDFAAVLGYLVERNPVAASELGQRIFAVIDKRAAKDFEGPEQAFETGEVVRSWAVPPVRIYYQRHYQRHEDALWIVRIYHQSQRPIVR